MSVGTWKPILPTLRISVFSIRESTAFRSRFLVANRKISNIRSDPEIDSFKIQARNEVIWRAELFTTWAVQSDLGEIPALPLTGVRHGACNLTSGSITFLTGKRETWKLPITGSCNLRWNMKCLARFPAHSKCQPTVFVVNVCAKLQNAYSSTSWMRNPGTRLDMGSAGYG